MYQRVLLNSPTQWKSESYSLTPNTEKKIKLNFERPVDSGKALYGSALKMGGFPCLSFRTTSDQTTLPPLLMAAVCAQIADSLFFCSPLRVSRFHYGSQYFNIDYIIYYYDYYFFYCFSRAFFVCQLFCDRCSSDLLKTQRSNAASAAGSDATMARVNSHSQKSKVNVAQVSFDRHQSNVECQFLHGTAECRSIWVVVDAQKYRGSQSLYD